MCLNPLFEVKVVLTLLALVVICRLCQLYAIIIRWQRFDRLVRPTHIVTT